MAPSLTPVLAATLLLAGAAASPPRVERTHATEPGEPYRDLGRRYEYAPGQTSAWLSAEAAALDLDQLEYCLEDQYAYLTRLGVEYRGALDAIRCGLGEGILVADLAIAISKMLALFGDGHTGVRGLTGLLPAGWSPYDLELCDGRLIAGGVDHQVVRDIQGVDVASWLTQARKAIARGSPQLQDRLALDRLECVDFVRQEMNLPAPPVRAVTTDTSTWFLKSRPPRPSRRDRPSIFERMEPGDIGLLRLAAMDESAAILVHQAMQALRGTSGLIIDVRGNGGGSRDALLALAPYLLPPESSPRVANVAAYRLSARFELDHLADRHLFRRDDPRFDDADRAAIDACMRAFVPEWAPPEGRFSSWHFLLLRRAPGAAHVAVPVVVLLDGACFSATDVFLGALAELPGVTLIGTPSGGASGRTMPVRLHNSGLEIRLSSMASFRPDGRLYDGRGIEVDVFVPPAVGDLAGLTDTQMDAARQHLRRSGGPQAPDRVHPLAEPAAPQ